MPTNLFVSIEDLFEKGYINEDTLEDEDLLYKALDNYLTDEYGDNFGFEIDDRDSEFVYVANIDWVED